MKHNLKHDRMKKMVLVVFIVNAFCLAYSIATRFTNFLFAPKSEKLIIFIGCLILSSLFSTLVYLVILRMVVKSIPPRRLFRILLICAFISVLLFYLFYQPPPFPESHELEVAALGSQNPQADNSRVELIALSTISYPNGERRRIPITQFEYDGVWRGIGGDNFGLFIEDNQAASFQLRRFMQAGIEIQFQAGPNGGFVKINWDGDEEIIDLYRQNSEVVSYILKPAFDWRRADPTRKILVGSAAFSDFVNAVSLLSVILAAFIQVLTSHQDLQIRNLPLLAAFAGIIFILLLIVQQVNTPVAFENLEIESGVRDFLNKPEGNIYQRQLLSIVKLDLSNKGISNLEGIDQLANLIELDLRINHISDISDLERLTKLQKLNLRDNQITDISALQSLQNLEYLNIHSNSTILSISPIGSLEHLRTLIMGNVPVNSEGSVLGSLLHLRYLNLRNCDITDIDFISNLTDLEYLNLHSNEKIRSIEPLKDLANLETLILANVPIKDQITYIANLNQLRYLNLRNSGLTDISDLSELSNLQYLNLHSNPNIGSIVPIEGLSGFKHLILQNTPIGDQAHILTGFHDLQTLNIRNTGIEDVSFLETLMSRKALQDNPKLDFLATVDIRDNPVLAEGGENLASIRPYWHNISLAEPKALPFYAALDQPEFSKPSGFYAEPLYLTLSHPDPDSPIYFTLDGSEPTITSDIYTNPILLEDNGYYPNPASEIESIAADWKKPDISAAKAVVVRAKVIKENLDSSSPAITQTYFIGPDFENRYLLPIVSLVSNHENLFDEEIGIYVLGKNYREIQDLDLTDDEKGKFANFDQRGEEWERPVHIELIDANNQSIFSQDGGIRIHGGGSRRNPQKSFRIYAGCEYDTVCLFNYPFFQDGLESRSADDPPKYETFLLRNAGQDWMVSMMRDAVSQDLLDKTGLDTQSERPAVLFLNGEYWGVYELQERYDEYYLLNHYGLQENQATILRQNGEQFRGNAADAQQFAELVDFYTTQDLSDPENYIYLNTKIDISSYMDYLIANIFLGNTDWPDANIYLWRKSLDAYDPQAAYGHDGRWRWMIFDMDFCFGLQGYGEGYKHNNLEHAQIPGWGGELFRALLANETFRVQFINRYSHHLNSTFTPDRMIDAIDKNQKKLEPVMAEFFERWGSNRDSLLEDWVAEIETMREFARKRQFVVQQHILDQFGLSGISQLSLNTDFKKGYLTINSFEISQNSQEIPPGAPWVGTFFNDVPITVAAISQPGYRFSHWQESGSDQAEISVILSGHLILTPVFTEE